MERNATILIVDDEEQGRTLLERLLNKLDCNLAFAGTGSEALAQAAKLIPDLILLDVMLPDMNGYEVCAQLRADPLLAEVPIVMLTALDDQKSRLKGIGVGADDFVSKPFDPAELKMRVQTITRLNRYRRLLAERAKFEWVVDHADHGYLMVNETGHITYANPKARLYLGLPADKDKPNDAHFLTLAQKQYHCRPKAAWATWLDLPQTAATRYLIRPEIPVSNAFWLQVNILNLPVGSETGKVIHLRDITERVNLQRETHSFHAMVSHKLRTPLVGVFNGLELVLEYARKLSNADMIRIGEIALQNVQRLRNQIDDIINYLHTSTLIKSNSSFNLSQLPLMVTKLSANLELESVTVLNRENLAGIHILLAKRTVELMLWEILENSKKFHPQQTPSVEIMISRANSRQVRLRVSDNGQRLSPEQLDQILTPYYQGDKYFTGEVTGMGLGLSMVAMVTWGAGGLCHIYNREDGPGVVVELTLPLAEDADTISTKQ